jgi:intracellular sulfur oxidation DsrE/DsrF family protein
MLGRASVRTIILLLIGSCTIGARAEDIQQTIRSPQSVRERFEALRKAQEQIEAARRARDRAVTASKIPSPAPPEGQATDHLTRPAVARQDAPWNQQAQRLVIQVDQNDPAVMNLALNNAENVIEYYNSRGEDVQVEIVTFGPGLHMLRADTSPVKDRIEQLKNHSLPGVAFAACGNTQAKMEKSEGKPITIVPQATMVPSGVVRLAELQRQGWSYIRP